MIALSRNDNDHTSVSGCAQLFPVSLIESNVCSLCLLSSLLPLGCFLAGSRDRCANQDISSGWVNIFFINLCTECEMCLGLSMD